MDFNLSVLTATGRDADRWTDLLHTIEGDIYFYPQYLSLFDGTNPSISGRFGQDPRLICYGDEDNYIVHPILLKSLNSFPWFDSGREDGDAGNYSDAVSPWYYGGPLLHMSDETKKESLVKGFFAAMNEYCREHAIVSEFTRLHPLLKNQALVSLYAKTDFVNQIVYVDLTPDEAVIWENYKQENRKSINRAVRNGVEVEVSKTPADITAFHKLYTRAMIRLGADNAYFFSLEFISNLFKNLGDGAQLFLAKYQGEIISGSILIGKGNYSHDYLRAFNTDFSKLVPNNLIVHKKILWAKQAGYKIFSLQGGHSPDDGIFRFKSTFSKTTADFYVYKTIHDQSAYDMLSLARDAYDRKNGITPVATEYFPYYRR
ncbi:MAG: GNAT family N-acetyltransferase [Methanoregula sp.]|jgi:hypothetical protein|uniref:lipid II:glycine glycyltransferase FemX n=1 Tax=Methanoregula sp. TaxID=2052170 RepID=UPI003C157148